MTVRAHVSNVLGKLHLASRTQAALYAIKKGIASLDDSPLAEENGLRPGRARRLAHLDHRHEFFARLRLIW